MKKQETIFGWHFVGDKLRDGSPIPRDGVWLPVIDDIKICERGYHGSLHPFDALSYAPGNTLCYCEFRGQIIHDEDKDKFVAQQRRIVHRMDATEMLYYFARMQAVSVAHLWDPPDIVLDWLMTGDLTLRDTVWSAASSATESAASSAAWSAASSAAESAWSAACSAAGSAAWSATESAWSAAWSASGSASGSAASSAWSAARNDFNELVLECFGLPVK